MSAAHAKTAGDPLLFGLMAEFHSPSELVAAATQATEAGYTQYDCYTPYPIEELHEAMPHRRNWLPLMVLMGGIIGGLAGFSLAYFTSTTIYPINVGGRPLNSWPSFIPITFECTVLLASLTAVFGMLGLNGFPMPYHPVFNAPRFASASRDRFFLCIEATDPMFDRELTRRFLERLVPRSVAEVEH